MIGLYYVMQIENKQVKDVAEYLNVSPPTVSQWIHKVRPIPKERIAQLAAYFKVYPSEVFYKELNSKEVLDIKILSLQAQQDSDDKPITQAIINEWQFKRDKAAVFVNIDDILVQAYKTDSEYVHRLISFLNAWVSREKLIIKKYTEVGR